MSPGLRFEFNKSSTTTRKVQLKHATCQNAPIEKSEESCGFSALYATPQNAPVITPTLKVVRSNRIGRTKNLRGGLCPPRRLPLAPHGGAVAPQRRKIRYPRQAKPAGDFGRPMRAAIPMLGEFLPLTTRGFLMCPILLKQNGTLIRRPRWRARASEMRRAGGARPRTWFTLGGTPRLSRRLLGAPPPCPLFACQRRERSEAFRGRRCAKPSDDGMTT